MDILKIGIIICSRINSSRVPEKPLVKINGMTIIEHLISRINYSGIPCILAVPNKEIDKYRFLKKRCIVRIIGGNAEDPMMRMYMAAKICKLDAIIRISHDKVFIDDKILKSAIKKFEEINCDYLYSSKFTDGSGFEIISFKALHKAVQKYKKVEHISYAIRSVTNNIHNFNPDEIYNNDFRFLLDYPEDIKLIETIFSTIGNNCSLDEAINFVKQRSWVKKINQLPLITVYTCNYNMQRYLKKCMGSVASQQNFKDIEYIIIDDFSTDKSLYYISKFATIFNNVRWIKNDKNIGLASSSNVALKNAKGRYIVRLDADDYFISNTALIDLVKEIEEQDKDIIYPSYYHGTFTKILSGSIEHHVGGALFKTRALNYIKFTDKLRGYDGLDVYLKAKKGLEIGYLDKPIFFYRQHDESLSKNNLEKRAKIKKELESLYI